VAEKGCSCDGRAARKWRFGYCIVEVVVVIACYCHGCVNEVFMAVPHSVQVKKNQIWLVARSWLVVACIND